jgi:hypothetical protein
MNPRILAAAPLLLLSSLNAQITYVDATTGAGGNTTLADGSAYTPPLNGITGADNQWEQRTPLGSGGTIYESGGENVTEDAPELRTKISGLTAGVEYTVFVYFWDPGSTTEDWSIRAGLSSNPGANTIYSAGDATAELGGATAAVTASTLVHGTGPTIFAESGRVLLAASLGTATADANGEILVYVDDLPTSLNVNRRSWYDGLGYQRTDTDNDGLPDSWEIANGTDPEVNDAGEDPDGDDLTNLQEFQNGGHPFLTDTDSDGVDDGVEFAAGMLLNNPDSDSDFYLDGVEIDRSTDPLDFNSFPSPADGLKVDFSSQNAVGQAGVFHHSDWFNYVATHELAGVTDRTEVWTVPAFADAEVNFTVAYPDTTAATVRQMIGRSDLQAAAYTGDFPRLMRDWIGIDTRVGSGGNGTATDTTMTFTFAGLPAGTYRYRGYHHDVELQNGQFGLKVTDAGRSNADLGNFRITRSAGATYSLPENPEGDPATLSSTIDLLVVSNGSDPVTITYTGRETANVFTSFVVVNGFELVTDIDSDGDFVPDSADLHPGQDDGTLDDDGDGLSNLREYHLGTSPTLADTDDDGLSDAVETNAGTFTSAADSGTSPFRADTDGDGANDGDEVAASSNPFDPASLPATGPIKVLAATLNATTNEYTIQWESATGATYDIVYSDTLTGSVATWPLAADDVVSQGATTTHVIPLGSPRPAKRFFVVIRN